MKNVVENDVLEATDEVKDEAKDARTGLENVSYGLAKGTGKVIGGSCRMAQRFSKTVKQCGEKIAGVRHRAVKGDDLSAQLEEGAGEVAEDSDVVAFKASTELEPDTEETTPGKRATRALVAALESDLAAVRAELEAVRSQAEGTSAPLTSQLTALQEENESLLADLEQARSLVQETILHKDAANKQVTVLESELAAAKKEIQKAHGQADQTQDELTLQLRALQTKNEALITGLEKIQSKVDETNSREEETAEAATEPVEEEIVPVITETIDQPTEEEPVETEQPQPEALAVDEVEVVETETAPAEVTVEEVNAADFDIATDKVFFIKALSNIAGQDETTRIDAVKEIGNIRHELSVRVLAVRMATEPNPQIRFECIKALTELNMTEGLPAVKRALADEAGPVRLAAVWGLYRLAGPTSGRALTRMFADEDKEVRRRAATCIGWLGKEEFATALIPLLDDKSIPVRQATVETMGSLRSRAVVSALIKHLSDPEKIIRKAIVAALTTITGKKIGGQYPKDNKSAQKLIARWRQWWIVQDQE